MGKIQGSAASAKQTSIRDYADGCLFCLPSHTGYPVILAVNEDGLSVPVAELAHKGGQISIKMVGVRVRASGFGLPGETAQEHPAQALLADGGAGSVQQLRGVPDEHLPGIRFSHGHQAVALL